MASPLVRSSPVTGSAEWGTGADVVAGAGVGEPVDPLLPAPVLVDGDVVVPAGAPELGTVGDVAAAGAASTTTVPCMNG
jgi:hypothetical protein